MPRVVDRLLWTAAGSILVVYWFPTPATMVGALVAWVIILGLELWREW